ncbi:MAG TPA: hypothetical protein VKD66_21900 [Streptosporangiaceae bacterium]|nr:hypothetical protein [Streptosporangiaceae bacterium]
MPEQADDDELEEQLRQLAARFDPVPPRLLDAAVDSYTWRTVDSDLAELVFDSQAEDQAALVRGGEHTRLLSFAAGGLIIDLEITGSGQDRRIIGQLAPPQRAAVEIRQGSDVTGLDADELGRFSGPLRTGPFSLRFRTGAEADRPVVTDWIAV